MNNIGEELTSIYLRIHGFLQLSDFVIHRTYNDEMGECDILALRLREMRESVYFKDTGKILLTFKYSDSVLGREELSLTKDVYLWVEVTLRNDVTLKYSEGKFSDSKCSYVINRLGIQDWADVDYLSSNPFYEKSRHDRIFAKVLVCSNKPKDISEKCFYTPFDYIRGQLKDWFNEYKEIKESNWNAWVNPYLQGLAKGIL